MKLVYLFTVIMFLYSCWKPYPSNGSYPEPQQKVWGNKPVYAAEATAKQISYMPLKMPVYEAGNIYAYNKYIFQVDVGRGIHVIDNSVPANADRIGFIKVNGCSQISIQGAYLYTNSYDDLVTLNISDPANLQELSRVKNALPAFGFNYPLVQPEESGYYECPGMDSVVIGWIKDSIYSTCYKN